MPYRKEKVSELIRRIISEMLLKEIKDPRIGFLTLTGVSISSDFTSARVGISVLGDEAGRMKTLEGLRSAAGFIQFKLNKILKMRVVPRIEFFLDTAYSNSIDMVNLLDKLVHESAPPEEGDES